ncbi:hypothetical protein WICPIJ_000384 [Wickerhamomyces pijperi]|uniref:Vps72/YL1 C-terminal domain-containing protein n=1 Tax=Wickerhamomyces pijperi TaxID=599730 RepID=A0A9P8QGQ3_WICPI|nr:hypothetical protein WICPIJ_000384 [Wickerhamomyces pijperi]
MPLSDSLIATRKRRANAGSRLKQLLQAEEISNAADEDDENVDLLFQEDEDDKEFNVGDEDRYGYVPEESEDDGDRSEAEAEGEDEDEGDRESRRSVSEEPANELDEDGSEVEDFKEENDEMFSDSDDDSGAASDSDEGEKELQKQERVKKRAAQKKAKQAPQIKVRQPVTAVKKPKPKSQSPTAETLLSLTRRASSRKAAVQSKLQLVTRLKDEEVRRKNMKQVTQRVEYVELTQEERLAEALETEKYNITQLNKYKEQEVDKQAKRRALQLSKRKKIENMVTFKSAIREVPLIEEIQYEHWLQTRDKVKKKDRRGRKSDKQKREEEEAKLREIERKKQMEELERQMKLKRESLSLEPELEGGDMKRAKLDGEDQPDQKEASQTKDEPQVPQEEVKDQSEILTPAEPEPTAILADEKHTEDEPVVVTTEEPAVDAQKENSTEANPTDVSTPQPTIDSLSTQPASENEPKDPVPLSRQDTLEIESSPATIEVKVESTEPSTNLEAEIPEEKKVTFALPEDSTIDTLQQPLSATSTINLESSVEPVVEPVEIQTDVYEGPEQKVGYNLISFETALKVDEMKEYLFGKDSLLTGSRRSKDVEPLFKISNMQALEDESEALNLFQQKKLIEEIKLPDFSILETFPSFGTYTTQVKIKPVEQTTTKVKIQITTPAPTGITLPSTGMKKTCLITGKPCVYFDPKCGIPYSSVDAYRYIQKLESNGFYWCDFPKGGAYVGAVEERHAKGVPEGFDL